jgi:hypothetical protein
LEAVLSVVYQLFFSLVSVLRKKEKSFERERERERERA